MEFRRRATLGAFFSVASTVALSLLLPSAPWAYVEPCPIVDRGSPTDGFTTITVVVPPVPCEDDPAFAGWLGMEVTSAANNNGVAYPIDIRWNRVDQPVSGSFTWMMGGPSTASARLTNLGGRVQDRLDTLDLVRSIEIRFLGHGTEIRPRNGFVNISAVYADVLEYLVTNGIATGVIGHFGSSAGSMMAANALAYHGIEELVDGVVFGGGPFWTDLERVCTEPADEIFGSDGMREIVDGWTWLDYGGTYCADMAPESDPPHGCRSTLGTNADLDYPSVIVSTIVGTLDSNNPWMDASAWDYFETISAERKTFDRPVEPHYVLQVAAGAEVVYDRIREIVDANPTSVPQLAYGSSGAPPIAESAPNPFVSSATFSFAQIRAGLTSVTIYDAQGELVRVLSDGFRTAGRHELIWDGDDTHGHPVGSGVYFYHLESSDGATTLKTMRVR
jgi:hypothetical protein